MMNVLSVSRAKAELSAIVNAVHHRQSEVVLTRKGKNIAVIVPFARYVRQQARAKHGLADAAGGLAEFDREISEMNDRIHAARRTAADRPVRL